MVPSDVVNNALDLVKRPRIASFYDGSPEALHALDIYVETRDELFHELAPDWARKDAQLVVLRQAPADMYQTTAWSSLYPPLPWRFAYAFPDDCVNPLQLKPSYQSFPVWRPRYVPWRLAHDALIGVNTILTDQESAIVSYTAQVIDPAIWHEDFTMKVIAALAAKLAPERQNANNADRRGEQSAG